MSQLKNNRLIAMDAAKFIASLFVVFIHCTFYGTLGISIKAIARFAVPFFFICSGYFLYGNKPEKILKKLLNIIRLLIFASVLYFIFNFCLIFMDNGVLGIINYLSGIANLKRLIKLLLFNYPLTSTHLWYLLAAVYVYFIYYLIAKLKIPDKIIFITAFILIIVHLLIWQINLCLNITENTFYVRNFLFIGFPFVTIGTFIKKYQHKIPEVNGIRLTLLLSLGALLSVSSRLLLGNKSLPVGAIIISVSLFIYVLNIKMENCCNFIKNAGIYSTYIYIFHPIIIRLVQFVLKRIGVSYEAVFCANMMPIIVCIVTIVLVMVFCKVKQYFDSFLLKKSDKKL